jgi:hypothetical protein
MYYCDPPIVNTGCYRMIVGILHVLYSDLKQNPWGLDTSRRSSLAAI